MSTVANRAILGASAHGAADCFRYQGAPNVLWAESLGLAYTELISHPHSCRTVSRRSKPTARSVLDVICLPHHVSFDR